ncbi:MAG: DUF5719 family protein [Propionicimonas sp.]|nr:DUF5719 family protein [Propionicimonas sp.]
MNRWLVPGITVAVVGAVVAAALTVLPAQQPPVTTPAVDDARLSLVCPVSSSATATGRLAAVATGAGLRTATLAEPADATDAEGVAVIKDPSEPQIVSGLRSASFGAVSLVRAADGPERGLSAAACASPVTEQWFTAVGLNDAAQAAVELTNIDKVDAIVDVAVWGDEGRVNAPGSRGIVVAAGSTRTLPLSVIATSANPVTLQVVSEQGRVAATLRQRLWDGSTPAGSDWIPPAAKPSPEVVISGIPDDAGSRQLVIGNPGERTTSVAIELLTGDGPGQLPGLESVEVPAGTTRAFDLTEVLGGDAAGLRLTADFPVTAGVALTGPGGKKQRDPAWTSAQHPLGPDGVWPLPEAKQATTVLQLANPSGGDSTATVVFSDQTGTAGQPVTVQVPAGSITRTPVPAAATAVVRVQAPAGSPLRASLLMRDDVQQLRGLAVIPLTGPEASLTVPTVRFDPHAG